jgi:hypothetical protein
MMNRGENPLTLEKFGLSLGSTTTNRERERHLYNRWYYRPASEKFKVNYSPPVFCPDPFIFPYLSLFPYCHIKVDMIFFRYF